ncbi:MAG: hypothetical protein E7566_07775 [Ruminococcaceae bacterium]|nr:hypothetical protein [Oscillospiraceae bacterium]
MENKDFKYNYILYNMETAYKWQMYKDLLRFDNVRMCKGALPMNESLLHKLHKFHWSARVNEKIKLPFKKTWFKRMTNGRFNNNKPTCFILFGGQYAIRDPRLLDYIKSLNPNNKIVLHYRDIIRSEGKHLEMLKEKTDLIYTYDKGEAEKYDLYYFESFVYSRMAETTEPEMFEYDLFFVGYAKDRLPLIHSVYQKAVSNGLKCKFIIVKANEIDRISGEGLEYLDNVIPYQQVIDIVQKSRCILEITQENAEGATMRTAEAILYKRKLISNCKRASSRPHYNSLQMKEFTCADDFDIDFVKESIPYSDLPYEESFSPVNELLFLENYFKQTQS